MPGPLKLTAVSIDPPQFNASPTFTELVNETLGDADAKLADLAAQSAAMEAAQTALEAAFVELDPLVLSFDDLLLQFDTVDWGSTGALGALPGASGALPGSSCGAPSSGPPAGAGPDLLDQQRQSFATPEPDLALVDTYVAGQRDAFHGQADALVPLGKIPFVLPNGSPGPVIGGPPAQGGPAKAGGPQYVLHLPLAKAGGPAQYNVNNLSGPNPPIVTAHGGDVVETIDGVPWHVALITINPARAGTFTGVVFYLVTGTIPGFSGTNTVQLQQFFQVVIEA